MTQPKRKARKPKDLIFGSILGLSCQGRESRYLHLHVRGLGAVALMDSVPEIRRLARWLERAAAWVEEGE